MNSWLSRVIAMRGAEQEEAILTTRGSRLPSGALATAEHKPSKSGRTLDGLSVCSGCGKTRTPRDPSADLCCACACADRKRRKAEMAATAWRLMEDGGTIAAIAEGLGIGKRRLARTLGEARAEERRQR